MASGEGGRERIADFDVSPPPRYVSTEEDEGAETSENHVVQEALATAKNLFASIAASVAGEFKIPALEYQLLGKMVSSAAKEREREREKERERVRETESKALVLTLFFTLFFISFYFFLKHLHFFNA